MSDIEKVGFSFRNTLTKHEQEHASTLDSTRQELLRILEQSTTSAMPVDVQMRLTELGQYNLLPASLNVPFLLEKPRSLNAAYLRQLETKFREFFHLGNWCMFSKLDVPTVYCYTLEEFLTPLLQVMDYSAKAVQSQLEKMVTEAKQQAENGGGMYGYYLPGRGCYLNGWLLSYRTNMDPEEATRTAEVQLQIMQVLAHEKLGHGFVNSCSALGDVKTRLGLEMIEIARRFNLRSFDTPLSSLRQQQHNMLLMSSRFLEEGWATWIETYITSSMSKESVHPRYNLGALADAIANIPNNFPERDQVQTALTLCVEALFQSDAPLETMQKAIITLNQIGQIAPFDSYFTNIFNQPLPYVIGSLLVAQAELNLGTLCVPYAVLIAANLSIDLDKIGLADLEHLLLTDPRLHPDCRLAALSRLSLRSPNSLAELAERAKTDLSLSVPLELRALS